MSPAATICRKNGQISVQSSGRASRMTRSPPAYAAGAGLSRSNRVICSSAGASSRAFTDPNGVGRGAAISVAPAATSAPVTPATSSTSNASRIRGATARPTSTSSMNARCAGFAISNVARPASRMVTSAPPGPANAACSRIPNTSR